jgi:3-hydroxyisobutyrate dehydrogenase
VKTEIKKIGFIGLGSMGGDQSRELAKLPMQLTVYDIFPQAMERFRGKAVLAGEIADVGRDADVVGICVQDDKQVLQAVNGVLPAMKEGSILLIHSTVKPSTVVGIGERAAKQGVHVLDASVSRTEMTKDGPFVYCMTGGDAAIAERVQVVLKAYSTDTMHVGPLGSAMALKICNNLASWSAIMIGLEAFDLAEAAGVPLDKLLTVMKRNGVLTPPAQAFVAFRNDRGDETRRSLMAVQASIGEKDLMLAEALASEAHTTVPIATQIRSTVKGDILEICRR